MSKQANKNHHYIPQCYLRNFSSNKTSIWAYDKIKSNSYPTAIDSVCCLEEFFTLPQGSIDVYDDERKNQLYLECDYFANNIEPAYGRMLSEITSNKEKWLKNNSELAISNKYEFAKLTAIQWLRLPSQRDALKNLRQNTMPKIIDLLKEGMAIETGNDEYNNLDTNTLVSELTPNPVLDHANILFANEEMINLYATAIANNFWEFSVSLNDDIYTSDFPLVVNPHVSNVRPICEGLASYGSELSFPISKDIVLTIWDREYFPTKQSVDCKFTFFDNDKEKRRKNLLTYYYAERHVFCNHQNFGIIEFVKNLNNGNHHFMKPNL
jgi:hypothetical protein